MPAVIGAPSGESTLQKRQFLAAALGAAAVPALAKTRTAPIALAAGPVLLTITGAIGKGNRGPLDPALDQMMSKQKIRFGKAQVYDFATLAAMPAVTLRPTLEYDAKPHALSGPLLGDVIDTATAGALPGTALALLRAVDGYVVQLSMADLRKYRYIVATHLDGKPMPLGGLGPLWAIYDADRFPEMMARPLTARFTLCPWAMYHIELRQA
ncbi:MAG: molybdopterin-dependent oxidoreductase [Herbaspirillum sp.]|jgi:hypothetical protein|nr:molybdopterin-dependent oxidoreductase [Herbaspirillum sp.]